MLQSKSDNSFKEDWGEVHKHPRKISLTYQLGCPLCPTSPVRLCLCSNHQNFLICFLPAKTFEVINWLVLVRNYVSTIIIIIIFILTFPERVQSLLHIFFKRFIIFSSQDDEFWHSSDITQ